MDQCIIGHVYTRFIQSLFDGQDHAPFRLNNRFTIRLCPPAHANVNPAGRQIPCQGFRCGIGLHAFDSGNSIQHDPFGLVQIILISNTDIILRAAQVISRAHDDGIRVDFGIGYNDLLSIIGFDDRRPGLNVIHRTLKILDLDLVTDLERLPQKDQKPSQPVLKDVLERKTNRHR